MLSSTEECPSIIIPSIGIFSPGFTTTISPTLTSSTFIFISFPFLITLAIFGLNPINFLLLQMFFL